jgi:hypothetical protein
LSQRTKSIPEIPWISQEYSINPIQTWLFFSGYNLISSNILWIFQ